MKEIKEVKVLPEYRLLLTFENNEKRIKDMKPYLEKGIFKQLKNKDFFNKVKIAFGTISWGEELDICADSLYETSQKIEEEK